MLDDKGLLLTYVFTRLDFFILNYVSSAYEGKLDCKSVCYIMLAVPSCILCLLRLLIASFCLVLDLISCFVHYGPRSNRLFLPNPQPREPVCIPQAGCVQHPGLWKYT